MYCLIIKRQTSVKKNHAFINFHATGEPRKSVAKADAITKLGTSIFKDIFSTKKMIQLSGTGI
jgi:hypothetical protein